MPRGGNGFGYNPKFDWTLVVLDALGSELLGFGCSHNHLIQQKPYPLYIAQKIYSVSIEFI